RDAGFAPHQLLHGLLGLHPRASGFTPAGRAENRHLESESLRFAGGVAHGVEPRGRAEFDLGFDGLPAAIVDVRKLKAADADALHPLEILRDALLRHVAHCPMPPRARFRRVGWNEEAGLEWIAGGRLTDELRHREQGTDRASEDLKPAAHRK